MQDGAIEVDLIPAQIAGLGTQPVPEGARIADSGPSRTVIPAHCGQQSGDCGQFLMSV